MQMAKYLGAVADAEQGLADALREVAGRHAAEYEVHEGCTQMARWSAGQIEALQPHLERHGREPGARPQRLRAALFEGDRSGALGLLQDLEDLEVLAGALTTLYTIVRQAAAASKDRALKETSETLREQNNRRLAWLCTQIKNRAPQTLLVPPGVAAPTAQVPTTEPAKSTKAKERVK
jgi:hypothetical protein